MCLLFVYIQILFSISSWEGNQRIIEHHIVQKLLFDPFMMYSCLGDPYKLSTLMKTEQFDMQQLDTMTKERLKEVAANCGIKRSNKSAVSSLLISPHIFLYFPTGLFSHYFYISSCRKGLDMHVTLTVMPCLKL